MRAPDAERSPLPGPSRLPCPTCPARGQCLPALVGEDALAAAQALPIARRRLRRGQRLFMQGDAQQALHAVRSGGFKLAMLRGDGREQVLGFRFAGAVLGLDGLADGRHASTATALQDSEVCPLPLAGLRALGQRSPPWRDALCRLGSAELVRDHAHARLMARTGTRGRVADFLLQVMALAPPAGAPAPVELRLRMSRAEIGSYLGLTMETVSRTLSAFQAEGWLAVSTRRIVVLDAQRLRQARGDGGEA